MGSSSNYAIFLLRTGLLAEFLAQGGGGVMVVVLEEFDKVRDVGKGTLGAYLRDGLLAGGQQDLCQMEALSNQPTMWWCAELCPKLLLECCERAVGLLGKLFDGDVVEDVVIDRLYKLCLVAIGTRDKATAQAVILTREDYQHQLRELHLLVDFVVAEGLKAEVTTYGVEELRQHLGRSGDDKIVMTASFAEVITLRADGISS